MQFTLIPFNSPFTNKNMVLKNELRIMIYKEKVLTVQFYYYLCEDSKEQFTTTELDELNMVEVYKKYKEISLL